ncbi:hypothetical protein [Paenarthrobacter sp. NPDC018779]|uniref:hypothetical protein n=1 Tax=Paenarthrobacter sp. NPDC018779 TaxID=3364375 RepID=UPI0037C92C66
MPSLPADDTEQLVLFAALVRKLGGQVTITKQELIEAYDLELMSSEEMSFDGGISFKVGPKPVTVQGEVIETGSQELTRD